MVPADYFLFSKLKSKLKWDHYDNVKQIQTNVTRELKSIPIQDFQNALNRLMDRARRCVELGGMYTEE